MPKVKITDTKGLVQEGGSGTNIQNRITVDNGGSLDLAKASSFSPGNRTQVTLDTNDFSSNRLFLSASHSGKTIILGDADAAQTYWIPNQAGFHARFAITGSLTAAMYLSASTDFGCAATYQPFRGGALDEDGTASDGIFGGTENEGDIGSITFVQAAAVAGDYVEVEVLSTGATGIIRVFGITTA